MKLTPAEQIEYDMLVEICANVFDDTEVGVAEYSFELESLLERIRYLQDKRRWGLKDIAMAGCEM
jgi:hypothetical protein